MVNDKWIKNKGFSQVLDSMRNLLSLKVKTTKLKACIYIKIDMISIINKLFEAVPNG